MSFDTPQRECDRCLHKLCRFAEGTQRAVPARLLSLQRGERLETCQSHCLRFWLVLDGTIASELILEDGRRQITGIEFPGDAVCGPMVGPDNPVWIEALEDTIICELDFEAQARGLRDNPAFMSAMFQMIHDRVERSTRHIAALGRLDSTERVILFLTEMALREDGRRPVQLPMSREDIADYLGLNAETVSRIFSRLRKGSLFTFLAPTEYILRDLDAIRDRLPVQPRSPQRAAPVMPGCPSLRAVSQTMEST